MLLWQAPAFAQTAPTQVAPAVPQGSPLSRILPPGPPAVGGALTPPAGALTGEHVPNATVAVRSVGIEGATAYPAPRLAALTTGLTGPAVTLARIDAARLAILSLYRGDGFVLTAVSAKLDRSGNLRFVVVEGRITDIKLDGNIGPAGTQVLRFLDHLRDIRPIDEATLERWLLLAQDVPGVSLHAVLRPSASEAGALTLVAQVQRQAFNGLFTVDNRAFRDIGPIEALLVLDANSFTSLGERTEVSLYHTEANTDTFGQASTEVFVGGSGLKVRIYAGAGDATPGHELRTIGYDGKTTVFGLGATYPLIRSRRQTLNLAASFDALETRIDLNTGPGGTAIRAGSDSIRVLRGGADYAVQDLLLGNSRPAISAASFRVSQGIPAFGASSNTSGLPIRAGERVDFTKASAQLSRTQTLFALSPITTVALRGLLAGQISNDVLPPAEKFFLGGPVFNRGFYSGEVTGDNALVASAELQLNTSYDMLLFGRSITFAAQFYGFLDWGETWENQSVDPNHHLLSAGGGVRINATRYTEVDLEGVHRFTRLPVMTPTGTTRLKETAFYWQVLTRF